MAEPRIRRYALVPHAADDGVRRFSLARIAGASGSVPDARRLERMEEVAAIDRRENGGPPERGGPRR